MRGAALTLAAAAALALSPPAGAAEGMAGAWSFDEPGAAPGATSAVAGRYGRALAFDGVDDRVLLPRSAAGAAMTLEAWVRPAALGGGLWRAAAVQELPNGTAGLYAGRGDGRPAGLAGPYGLAGRGRLPLNAWSHLATTYDGATLRLYIDAAPVAAAPLPGGLAGGPGTLSLGGTGAWGEYFAGLIDEVRVYDRALGPAELRRDRDTPLSTPALRTRGGRVAPRPRRTRLAARAYGERPVAPRRPASAHHVRWLR